MKLRVRFLQLPVRFDAAVLAQEVSALPAAAWRAHPRGFPGNDALPLITTDGDPASDARAGVMQPTPHLAACPYLMQVLARLGATWGRARLMRLQGEAEVTPHVDTDYYWRDHMRVHVPIVTQPTVRFLCGGETVHMAAGEAWVFDTWSLHSVQNDAVQPRIHLVADTVGGDGLLGLLDLIEAGRAAGEAKPGWTATPASPHAGPAPALAYERCNAPEVMTPWELRDHLGFLLGEAEHGHPRFPAVARTLNRLRVNWHALWAEQGAEPAGRSRYAALLQGAWRRLEAEGVHDIPLANAMPLGRCLQALIFNAALSDAASVLDGDARDALPLPRSRATGAETAAGSAAGARSGPAARAGRPAPPPRAPASPAALGRAAARRETPPDPLFDRPIFIVSPPRSGSTLLFETLSMAPGLHTIGGESHGLMEAIAELSPAARDWSSNRLSAADVPPAAAARLRARFHAALRDREGMSPPPAGRVRMLEKTPKNALRVPFLAAAFPDARFVYLYRDARETLASMMEAWRSGAFRTYPELPGWRGPPWSLLLTPGWRRLDGAPLHRIVADQWASATRILLDDLSALAPERWLAVRQAAVVATPADTVAGLCRALDLAWDRPLDGALKPSRFTLTPPAQGKWRVHAEAIEAVRSVWAGEEARAQALLERSRAAA